MSKLVIVWRVVSACDLACPFCGYSRLLTRPRPQASPEQLLAFGEVLRDYRAQTKREVLVSWLGGEPLLWKPLQAITRIFRHEHKLRMGVTTNGTTLKSDAMIQHLADDYDEVTISVDGLGAFHDRVRGAPGLYAQLRDGVRRLAEKGHRRECKLAIKVNTILMRDNLRDFEALCLELAGWGVQELTFNQLGGMERPEFFHANRLLPEQVRWLCAALPGIRTRAARAGLTIRGTARYLERMVCTAEGAKITVMDCQPGQAFLFIDEHGTVAPCNFTAQGYGVPLADLQRAADVLELPQRFAVRKREMMLSPCFDCHSTQVFEKFGEV